MIYIAMESNMNTGLSLGRRGKMTDGSFYRGMLYAQRGVATVYRLSVRLSVRPSVCDVEI